MRQPFSGTAEQIFMKLIPNDRGKCSLHRRTQMGARPPIIFGGLKTEKSRKVAFGALLVGLAILIVVSFIGDGQSGTSLEFHWFGIIGN